VSNALLLAVAERTREIGIFRAVGASAWDIFGLVHLEAVLVCVVGGGLGLVLAPVVSGGLEVWLRARLPFAPSAGLVAWDWGAAAVCLGGAVVLGSLAAWVPAWRACRISPREAMRSPGSGL
jgi:putative ABC transport system permease protein